MSAKVPRNPEDCDKLMDLLNVYSEVYGQAKRVSLVPAKWLPDRLEEDRTEVRGCALNEWYLIGRAGHFFGISTWQE